MPSNFDRSCSQCRRAGEKLFLKGDKCSGPKCEILKRNFAPGQHGPTARRSKKSGYGKQLAEKQMAKRSYGLRERQFANYVAEASKRTGDTGKFLIQYLESRLDNVIYRMGLAKSRASARQIVGHGHVVVNSKKVDIPSYRVKVGDLIAINDRVKGKKIYEKSGEALAKNEAPSWLHVEGKTLSAKVLNTPAATNIPFSAKTIIEFYSR